MADQRKTLDRIAQELDGKEWDADTIDRIANIVRDAGWTIRPPMGDDPDPYPMRAHARDVLAEIIGGGFVDDLTAVNVIYQDVDGSVLERWYADSHPDITVTDDGWVKVEWT